MASPSNSTFEAACPSKWNSGALPGRHAERSRVISPFLGLTARPPPPTLRPSATHSAGIAFVTLLRRAAWFMERHPPPPKCWSMASTPSSPEPARSLPVAVAQSLYLLLGMIAVSALGGVLLAAFFLPAVSASSAVAEDGVALFESYPSELEVEPLNEASRIEAADGSL